MSLVYHRSRKCPSTPMFRMPLPLSYLFLHAAWLDGAEEDSKTPISSTTVSTKYCCNAQESHEYTWYFSLSLRQNRMNISTRTRTGQGCIHGFSAEVVSVKKLDRRVLPPWLLSSNLIIRTRVFLRAFHERQRQGSRIWHHGEVKIVGLSGKTACISPRSHRSLTTLAGVNSKGCNHKRVTLIINVCFFGKITPSLLHHLDFTYPGVRRATTFCGSMRTKDD